MKYVWIILLLWMLAACGSNATPQNAVDLPTVAELPTLTPTESAVPTLTSTATLTATLTALDAPEPSRERAVGAVALRQHSEPALVQHRWRQRSFGRRLELELRMRGEEQIDRLIVLLGFD